MIKKGKFTQCQAELNLKTPVILNYLSFGGNAEYNDNPRYMFLNEGNEDIGNLH